MGHRVRLTVAVSSVVVATALAGSAGAAPAPTSSVAPSATPSSPSAATTAAPTHYTAGRYLVTFADEPVASYGGYEPGLRGHAPEPGQHLNPNSAAVQRWQAHLDAKHDARLAKVGATKIYDYTVTNNGVAADADRPAGLRAREAPGRRRPEQGPAGHSPTPPTPRTSSA